MRPFLIPLSIVLLNGLSGCTPSPGGAVDESALQEVLRSAVRGEAVIDSATLAARLLSNPGAINLIDLRSEHTFNQGHIEGARRMEPPELLSAELPPERDLVLYAADGSVGAQVATVLRLQGVQRAYYLAGGYSGWIAHLTSGDEGAGGDVDRARAAARRAAIACRFEGDYVAAAGLVPTTTKPAAYVPTVQPATPPASDSLGLGLGLGLGPAQRDRPRGKLKIGEGC